MRHFPNINNTCALCGKPLNGEGYAENEDAAISGAIYHKEHFPGQAELKKTVVAAGPTEEVTPPKPKTSTAKAKK